MSVEPLRALPLERLRERSSSKWRTYPPDVLPLFVAETDFPPAPAVTAALSRAVELGDTGYTPPDPGLRAGYADFARRRFGWEVDPAGMRNTGDVVMGIVEILRATTSPGDRVVVMPPVYPPFFEVVPEAGCVVEQVPLLTPEGADWRIDLAGVEAALRNGARAVLLCHPHNPTGTVHDADTLARLARLAARHGAVVVSDEIHAPLTRPGVSFTPFLASCDEAARIGFAVVSASKAFNLAGLKCALMVAASDGPAAVLRGLPAEVEWRTGLLGALAAVAAFAPESDEWLDSLLAALEENRLLLADLLREHLPKARWRVPDAGYLAWIDLSEYEWGDNPAAIIRRRAKVALHLGPLFGVGGAGRVRLNFGCSPAVLRDAVARIGALAAEDPARAEQHSV